MKPDEVTPYSFAVIGKQTLDAIEQKGDLLSHRAGNQWKTAKQLWLGRKIRLKRPRKWLAGIFRRTQRSPGKQLCESYVSHVHSLDLTTKHKGSNDKTYKQGLKFRIASAFKLAGVCEITKGKTKLTLHSTNRPIDKRVIARLDHLASCSPVRLAYEFIAKNKKPPEGYLNEVLQPALAELLISKGMSAEDAMLIVQDQCKKCSLLHEKHLSLESLMEIKNRLQHIAAQIHPSDAVSSDPEQQNKDHHAVMKLDAPCVKAGYECDSDDLWLIQHTVEHSRTMRLVGDFAKRILRWAQRNKRRSLFVVAGCSLEILLGGLSTGGIGAAVSAVTSIGATVGLFLANKVLVGIRSALIRKNLKQQNTEQNDHSFDRFLDNYTYLISQHSITNIMNAYENLRSSVNQLKPLHQQAHKTAKEQIQYQKQRTYVQLRKQQLEAVFGLEHANHGEYHGSYDHLMVRVVEKISRLNHQFNHEFGEIWERFEKMPEAKRWQIFNEAANQKNVKARLFDLPKNYHVWIKKIFNQEGDGLSAKLKKAFENVPKNPEAKRLKPSFIYNQYIKNAKKTSIEAAKTILSFMFYMRRPSFRRLIDFPRWVSGLNKPGFKDFLPTNWGPFVAIWIFYYFGNKISLWINKSVNQSAVKNLHNSLHSPEHKFNNQNTQTSSAEWKALRRETKDTLIEFVNTLKSLEKEHKEIEALLSKKSKEIQGMTEDQKDKFYATLLLRRKIFEEKLNSMLSGAVGHMHEEIVRGTWQQQQALKSLEIV